jgi:hypothetical protein
MYPGQIIQYKVTPLFWNHFVMDDCNNLQVKEIVIS